MTELADRAGLDDLLASLGRMGWRHLCGPACAALRVSSCEVLLRARLVETLQRQRFDYKGESHPLSAAGVEQVLRVLESVGLADGLLAANERLHAHLVNGITVTEFMPDGRKHQPTVFVIDWSRPEANRFEVCDDFPVLSSQATAELRPALVGFVNGIPLMVLEVDAPMDEAVERMLLHQRDDQIPQLFVHAQLLLALDASGGRYATTRTPARFWASWTREEEFDDAHIAAMAGRPVAEVDARDRLVVALLTPARLLLLLRDFMLFDRRLGKIVARHPQFFAVQTLLRRLERPRSGSAREGGVIWHAAGAGKSFTMVFLARALLRRDALRECRLLVITDRLDLERQLARNFSAGGAFGVTALAHRDAERSKAATGRELARRIARGRERITFALVQKFLSASRLPECRNDTADCIVLVDECHRSQGGETHDRMREALPNAAYVAFTGTPLLREEKTTARFGPIVHAYPLQQAVAEGTVAPLLYEERRVRLDIDDAEMDAGFERLAAGLDAAQRAQLARRVASGVALRAAGRRIEWIAWDIALHFRAQFQGIGAKGQLAATSKLDAIRYKAALDATGLVSSEIVISPPDVREGRGATTEPDEAAEVLRWWRRHVPGRGIDATQHERQVLQRFANPGDPDLLIVVDRLLTGFDEPRNAVLYIDKALTGHGLIQAVSRVNRLHEGKTHGLLVDYRGVLAALDTAIVAYQDLALRTQGGFDVEDIAGLYRPASHDADAAAELRPSPAQRLPGFVAFNPDDDGRSQALIDREVFVRSVHEPEGPLGGPLPVPGLGRARSETASPKPVAGLPAADLARPETVARLAVDAAGVGQPGGPLFSAKVREAIAKIEDAFLRTQRPASAGVQVGVSAGGQTIVAASVADALFRICLGALLQDVDALALDRLAPSARAAQARLALAMRKVVRDAVAEHSLNAQDIGAAIRRGLLPVLYGPLGLEQAGRVIERVLQCVGSDVPAS